MYFRWADHVIMGPTKDGVRFDKFRAWTISSRTFFISRFIDKGQVLYQITVFPKFHESCPVLTMADNPVRAQLKGFSVSLGATATFSLNLRLSARGRSNADAALDDCIIDAVLGFFYGVGRHRIPRCVRFRAFGQLGSP